MNLECRKDCRFDVTDSPRQTALTPGTTVTGIGSKLELADASRRGAMPARADKEAAHDDHSDLLRVADGRGLYLFTADVWGTFLLPTSLSTWLVNRARGYYQAWTAREDEQGLGSNFSTKPCPPRADCRFLVMATRGQNEVLAR